MDPTREPLWHGYTYRDIDRISRLVITMDPYRTDLGSATHERCDAVQFALIEYLATCERRPSQKELLALGRNASHQHVRLEMHAHGMQRSEHGGGVLPGFQRYWQASGRVPMDERVTERIAVWQIWPRLTLAQQRAVMALALTEDHQAAARTLGVPLGNYSSLLRSGRRRALALWHEHETPRRLPRDKRVLNRAPVDSTGKRRLTEAEVDALRDRRAAGATLAQLAVEVGYSKNGLCNLLRGKRRAAPDGPTQSAA
ncbi:hypothetical protein [Kitasatospora sp. NPDC001175]|uniref:hypothetical protein n=1 Tax=Kitasatospora sp. NPDC001175 TaxID=3157103 RepID=UPI003D03AA50